MELNPRENGKSQHTSRMVGSTDQWRGPLSWPGSPAQAPGRVGASTAAPCGDPGEGKLRADRAAPRGRNVGGVWSKGETDPRRSLGPASHHGPEAVAFSTCRNRQNRRNIPVNLSLNFFFFFFEKCTTLK